MSGLMPMRHPYCLADHKVLSTLEKPRESASAPTLEAVMPETSHRSSVSSRIQVPASRLVNDNKRESCGNVLKTYTHANDHRFIFLVRILVVFKKKSKKRIYKKNPNFYHQDKTEPQCPSFPCVRYLLSCSHTLWLVLLNCCRQLH